MVDFTDWMNRIRGSILPGPFHWMVDLLADPDRIFWAAGILGGVTFLLVLVVARCHAAYWDDFSAMLAMIPGLLVAMVVLVVGGLCVFMIQSVPVAPSFEQVVDERFHVEAFRLAERPRTTYQWELPADRSHATWIRDGVMRSGVIRVDGTMVGLYEQLGESGDYQPIPGE